MVSPEDLRRMAGKVRALGANQDDVIREALCAMADRYETDADGLDVATAEVAILSDS
jgi:hypothetical protein